MLLSRPWQKRDAETVSPCTSDLRGRKTDVLPRAHMLEDGPLCHAAAVGVGRRREECLWLPACPTKARGLVAGRVSLGDREP